MLWHLFLLTHNFCHWKTINKKMRWKAKYFITKFFHKNRRKRFNFFLLTVFFLQRKRDSRGFIASINERIELELEKVDQKSPICTIRHWKVSVLYWGTKMSREYWQYNFRGSNINLTFLNKCIPKVLPLKRILQPLH